MPVKTEEKAGALMTTLMTFRGNLVGEETALFLDLSDNCKQDELMIVIKGDDLKAGLAQHPFLVLTDDPKAKILITVSNLPPVHPPQLLPPNHPPAPPHTLSPQSLPIKDK